MEQNMQKTKKTNVNQIVSKLTLAVLTLGLVNTSAAALAAAKKTAVASGAAAASGRDGGGGGAIACPGKAPELLELWEARTGNLMFLDKNNRRARKSLQILESNDPVEVQVTRVLNKLKKINPEFGTKALKKYGSFKTIVEFSNGKRVMPPDDTDQPFIEAGCTVIGIGKYSDRFSSLAVDNQTLAKMSLTNQSAFWAHEAIYGVLRDSVPELGDSIFARYINAHLFADNPGIVTADVPLRLDNRYRCKALVRTFDGSVFVLFDLYLSEKPVAVTKSYQNAWVQEFQFERWIADLAIHPGLLDGIRAGVDGQIKLSESPQNFLIDFKSHDTSGVVTGAFGTLYGLTKGFAMGIFHSSEKEIYLQSGKSRGLKTFGFRDNKNPEEAKVLVLCESF